MGHIFISYSHKDKDYTYKLQRYLEQKGFEVWTGDLIEYGQEWSKVIQQQLATCDVFIVIVSENSRQSTWVQNELVYAQRKRKHIIPLLLGGDLWLPLETEKHVDVRGGILPGDDFYHRLSLITPPSQKPNIPQIFLSYAYEDRENVVDISRQLSKVGYQTWMDIENLLPGQDWDIEIKKALKESNFVLIFLTRNSITKKGYLQKEIKSALRLAEEKPQGTIYIIPIRLEDVKIPDNLKHIHWLDLYGDKGLEKLFEVLKANEQRRQRDYEQLRNSVDDVAKPKKHIFVAMPFNKDLEDCYFYGIKVPVNITGFNCIRVDETSFTGDILAQIKQNIETAVAVIAVLDSANPNVSLEVGYAWGMHIPTILLIQDTSQLPFDLRGQKCIVYRSIRGLEEALTVELKELISKGIIQ